MPKAESPQPSSWREWGSLRSELIDRVVWSLKASGRWTRDGYKLRSLNQHWCTNLNKHIHTATPHCSRTIAHEDLDSLVKFPNLTTIDFWRFISTKSPDGTKWTDLGFKEKRSRVITSLATMSKLPKLVQFVVDPEFLSAESYPSRVLDKAMDKILQKLSGITSLRLPPVSRYSMEYNGDFKFLHKLPIREIVGNMFPPPEGFFDLFKQLEKVPIRIDSDFSAKLDLSLRSLKELRLQVEESASLGQLAELTQLTGLTFRPKRVPDLGNLWKLSQIRCLEIEGRCGRSFEALHQLMSSLSHLVHLRFLKMDSQYNRRPVITDDLFEGLKGVECLSLSQYEFNGCAILRNLTKLTGIGFTRCSLRDEEEFWSVLDRGESVEKRTLSGLVGICNQWSLNLERECLARLTNLEVLDIGIYPVLEEGIFEQIQRLPKLRVLGFMCSSSRENRDFVSWFDFFSKLERLDLSSDLPETWDSVVDVLRRKSPSIQITLQRSRIVSEIEEHFL